MQIQAIGKHLRVSQRKMILLAESVKVLPPEKAVAVLAYTVKNGAKDLQKVIKSALNNAKNKNLDITRLKFASIEVLAGPAMKRFRAVSRGMAHTYKKRMCHVKVVLTEIKTDTKPVTVKQKIVETKTKTIKNTKLKK